ncbi:YcxB family protein [Hathewaya histolytica]|uniref:YcxB family protein n=1 Tax=Hathewaya histolytica TaxID=1498 RepID=UPI003B681D4E
MGKDKINMKINVSIDDKSAYIEYFLKKSTFIRRIRNNMVLRLLIISTIVFAYFIFLPLISYNYFLSIDAFNGVVLTIVVPILASIYALQWIIFKLSQDNIRLLFKENEINSFDADMELYQLNNGIEEYDVILDSNNIIIDTCFFKSKVSWKSIKEVVVFKNYLYLLQCNNKLALLIPLEKCDKYDVLKLVSKYTNKDDIKEIK